MITIRRASEFRDRLRAYKIVLDGGVVGSVRTGQKVEISVPPGKHRLYLKIDWCRSNVIEFESNGDNIEFECGNSLQSWRILLIYLYITFLCDKYLWLKVKK